MKLPRTRHVLAGVITGIVGLAIGVSVATRGPGGALDHLFFLSTPTNANDFWTMMAAAGAGLLLIVAYWGLQSLGLTKHDILTRVERDAKSCAVEMAEKFADEIIPLNSPILGQMAEHKVPVFAKGTEKLSFDPPSEQRLHEAQTWCKNLPGTLYGDSVVLLNQLEAWAMRFVHGLADQEVALGPCAPQFCAMVVQNYAALLMARAKPGSGKYPNVVALFEEWTARMEEEKRGLQLNEVYNQLLDLQNKGPTASKLAPLVGTKLDV